MSMSLPSRRRYVSLLPGRRSHRPPADPHASSRSAASPKVGSPRSIDCSRPRRPAGCSDVPSLPIWPTCSPPSPAPTPLRCWSQPPYRGGLNGYTNPPSYRAFIGLAPVHAPAGAWLRHAELDEPPAHPVDFREAMWGVVQSSVSELDFDFPAYAAQALRAPGRDERRPALQALARRGPLTVGRVA